MASGMMPDITEMLAMVSPDVMAQLSNMMTLLSVVWVMSLIHLYLVKDQANAVP